MRFRPRSRALLRRATVAAALASLLAVPACQKGGDTNGGADGGSRTSSTASLVG